MFTRRQLIRTILKKYLNIRVINQAHGDGNITGCGAIVGDETIGDADAGLIGEFVEGAGAEAV